MHITNIRKQLELWGDEIASTFVWGGKLYVATKSGRFIVKGPYGWTDWELENPFHENGA